MPNHRIAGALCFLVLQMQISAEHRKQEHESIKQQIEEDADYEIVEIKTNYEQLLYEEQEKNLKLRGETGVMRKKYLRWSLY